MADPTNPPETTNDEAEPGGLDRRTALKIAMGGATAAAVWSAPRIEGLSLAPDYAAAASCTGGSIQQITKDSVNCGLAGDTECWGNGCCGSWGIPQRVVSSRFTLNGNINGSVNEGGNAALVHNGIDPPFQSCSVNVSLSCNNGGSPSGGGNSHRTTNGAFNFGIDCNGGGNYYQSDPNGQVRINMSCSCA